MTIIGTFDYGMISNHGGERDRGTGYINVGMESFEIDDIGTVVKLKPTNVTKYGWKLVGKGCSAPGCESLIATPDMTPALVAKTFCIHNAECHNEKLTNHVVYLWQRTDPDY